MLSYRLGTVNDLGLGLGLGLGLVSSLDLLNLYLLQICIEKWVGKLLVKDAANINLLFFYKIINGLCPPYLCSLVPDTVGAITAYSLRNADQLQTVQTRTVLYSNSFLPSVVNEWSMLCDEAKSSDTVQLFKAFLNKNRPEGNALYNIGDRKPQVLHTRLRTRCSSLNQHLFVKHVIESPLCQCGHPETTKHFLFQCQRYSDIRHELIDKVSPITSIFFYMVTIQKT